MKKILLTSNMYPDVSNPHFGVFVKNVEALLSQKFKVKRVVLTKKNGKVHKLLAYLVWYAKLLAEGLLGRYDCIYNHFVWINAPIILMIKFFRPKIIIVENAHGGDLMSDNGNLHYVYTWAQSVLRVTDYLIVPSSFYAEFVEQKFGYPKEKMFISPSGGINTEIFHPMEYEECCKRLGLDDQKFWYGYVSRIEKDKGWDVFVKAFSNVVSRLGQEKVGAIMLGGGAEEELLRELIQSTKNENNIILHQPVEQSLLAQYYNIMGCYCFPTRSETLGLVGLEAMACGTLCLISDVPGPRSYANAENSILFSASSISECEEKMLKAYYINEADRKKYRRKANETVKAYERINVQNQLLAFFSTILSVSNKT